MRILRSIFLMRQLFIAIGFIVGLFILGSANTFFLLIAQLSLIVLCIALFFEAFILYRIPKGVSGVRDVPDRLSNGDKNTIYIHLQNHYAFGIQINLIDELPEQFQLRNKNFHIALKPDASNTIKYEIRPTERGNYTFGNINIFVSSVLRLIQRRYIVSAEKKIAVYPSFIQVKKYSIMAISDNLLPAGLKKVRKVGHNYEFDQIKEFVIGDDYRHINWNATAKMNAVMVNKYQDEKSQNVIAIINKGRIMKMPFEEMTLLDHSINSSLVMLNVAAKKDDYAGLLTFNKDIKTVLPPSANHRQIMHIQDALYNEKTDFTEANYEKLYAQIRHSIKRRSLIFLYTNFESMISLRREIPYLRGISKFHKLIVIIFKNTELDQISHAKSASLEEIYIKTIANKFQLEKELIVKELHKNGIDSVITSPENLTVNSINKYLEIKAKVLI